MFDSLSASLQKVFKNLRGYGRLSEKNIQEALREVRLALLEADVNFRVVKDFIAQVREKALGRAVLDSVTPGQQVIRVVHDELVNLLGGEPAGFTLAPSPAVILMLGLHGAGKTTTCGKLALKWKQEGKRVLLAACDIRRPAAVDQLRILAEQTGVEIVTPQPGESVPGIAKRAAAEAARRKADVLILDTGGRFQIDDELVEEVREVHREIRPANTILVLDAATGQEAVNVAQAFHDRGGLTGLVLTKLDGDARGGAVLSVRHVTGCPVILAGTGEKMDRLEPFYPERMASRILGMGDVLSLVEKAQQQVDAGEMKAMEERLRKNTFSLDDFLSQIQQLKKMGPLGDLLEMMPGGGQIPADVKQQMAASSGDGLKVTEAIIRSMTPKEREHPEIISASRRRRIAAGSGTRVQDVNELLKRFEGAKKMARTLKKSQKRLLRFGK